MTFGETARLGSVTEPRLSIGLEIPPAPAPVRITLAGELDGDEVPRLYEAVAGIPLADDFRDLRVEAGDLTYLDSAGIRALLTFHERAMDAGVRVVIDRVTRSVYRVLEISGLVDVLAVPDPAGTD